MLLLISVLLHLAAVLGDTVEFVSPGPLTSDSTPSSNAIHPIGSKFHIAWSGTNKSREISIILYQYNEDGQGLKEQEPLEYVFGEYSELYLLCSPYIPREPDLHHFNTSIAP